MSSPIELLVSRLDTPALDHVADAGQLHHREIPGWGAMRAGGCIADASLLLIAGKLRAESGWVERPDIPDLAFHDGSSLISVLVEKGLVSAVNGSADAPARAEMVECALERGLQDFVPWLQAEHAVAKAWAQQEQLVSEVWEKARQEDLGWRDLLRTVGLSVHKHNYRNQNQAIMALRTLVEWQSPDEMEPELVREAVQRDLTYAFAMVALAGETGAVLHDWSDMCPLYMQLAPDDAKALLTVRLPALGSGNPARITEIIANPHLDRARELTAAALAGGDVEAREIEQELLAAVPQADRGGYVYRQVSFFPFDAAKCEAFGIPPSPMFAISRWLSTVSV